MKTITQRADPWTFTSDSANAIRYADSRRWERKEITEILRILRGKGIPPSPSALRIVERIAGEQNIALVAAARKVTP